MRLVCPKNNACVTLLGRIVFSGNSKRTLYAQVPILTSERKLSNSLFVRLNARFSTLNVHLLLQTCVYFVNSPKKNRMSINDKKSDFFKISFDKRKNNVILGTNFAWNTIFINNLLQKGGLPWASLFWLRRTEKFSFVFARPDQHGTRNDGKLFSVFFLFSLF